MSEKITPAMQQFYDLKEQNSDCILFFRMGDFYEMFDDDAIIANKVLGIAMTSRNKNAEKPTPLAGIPFHAKEKYLPLLVKAGYKVAIAEQVSDPSLKGIVKREVVRIVTPATIGLEGENYENSNASSCIISISYDKNLYGLSILDLSNNKWQACEFNNFEELKNELYKVGANEVVLSKNLFSNEEIKETLEKKYALNIFFFEAKSDSYKKLTNHFGTKNLVGFGLEEFKSAQNASSLLLEYLELNQKDNFDFLNNISYLNTNNYIKIDEATVRSLDLIYNVATHSTKDGTLFGVLNKTKTISGSSLLMSEIIKPLNSKEKIEERQDFVEEFLKDKILLDKVRQELGYISNINGILNRIALNRTSPRDLINLKKSLISILKITEIIKESNNKKLINIIK